MYLITCRFDACCCGTKNFHGFFFLINFLTRNFGSTVQLERDKRTVSFTKNNRLMHN